MSIDDATICSEARLLIHHPGGAPHSFDLDPQQGQTIGRGSDCDLRLLDEHCSRHHCVVECQSGRWTITDSGSRNGTLVNGEKISSHALEEGDVIVVGGTWLVFTGEEEDTAAKVFDEGVDSDTNVNVPAFNPNARTLASISQTRPKRSAELDLADSTRMAGATEDTARVGRFPTPRASVRAADPILGESASIRSVMEQVANAAPTDSTVLLRGESGVGKELVARAIHVQSRRRNQRFVCVNCAALTESLLESELFGHERGAFTGATEKRRGKFELADRGTLLLDEIGEMSPTIQAKFLRVLEGHPFERVGGHTPLQVDVRVIAATNLNLEAAVRSGRFRRDLYFRLNVVPIDIPPLRARKDDIRLLAEYFAEDFAQRLNRPTPKISPAAHERLLGHDWPGNVRELRNAIERAMILSEGPTIDASSLSLDGLDTEPIDESKYEGLSIETVEMQHILRTLRFTKWNKSKAAGILGIERSTLDRKLKRHDVERPEEFRRG